ncbi:F-box/kelch-repeat protein At3g23880-like [Macadamia integrifolia]|uniref:F-box/kelch-repeat protein At3g23880-like n=1 Tax=Macadamia integrifolia TaxID=60698 RepID=UPI001C52BB1D|nr:F-box/kelch-repeat protein At3g23880-like [Macadamia integrifolia]
MMKNLPEDIMKEILLRLPVKSLLRFRCVSQDWQCLISDSSFITLYQNRNSRKENLSLFITDYYTKTFYTVEDNSCCKLFDMPAFTSTQLNGDIRSLCIRNRVVGSCNGLLCLISSVFRPSNILYREFIYLFNPTIRKLKKLPHSCRCICLNYLETRLGFGFDPISKDYKVVKIVYSYDNRTKSRIDHKDVWVYSLNSDHWRKLGDHIPVPIPIPIPILIPSQRLELPSRTPIVNAAIHWLVSSWDKSSYSIFSFDLVHEVFNELPQPPENGRFEDIVVVGGCLSVFSRGRHSISYYLMEMWVMKEYGVKESWTKQIIVLNSDACLYKPVESWDDEILFQHEQKNLVLYNIKSKTERDPGIHGLPAHCKALTHTKSLAMLKGLRTSMQGDGRKGKEEEEQ